MRRARSKAADMRWIADLTGALLSLLVTELLKKEQDGYQSSTPDTKRRSASSSGTSTKSRDARTSGTLSKARR